MADTPHDPRQAAVAAAASAPTASTAFADALGGPLGLVESGLPAIAFVTAYTASGQDARFSALIALGIGLALAVARLARRQTLQYAVSGLAGVALAAFVVSRTGRAEDFFLPGLLTNAAYAAAAVVSILIRRPLVGVVVGMATGEGMEWRQDPLRTRAYVRATYLWAGLFLLRLAVQLPLYLAGAVVALGVARVAMGLPLFAVGVWLSWLMLRPRTS